MSNPKARLIYGIALVFLVLSVATPDRSHLISVISMWIGTIIMFFSGRAETDKFSQGWIKVSSILMIVVSLGWTYLLLIR
jgi:hypothetical protein